MHDFLKFLFIYLFSWILYFFAENQQNLYLTVEIWAFLMVDTFTNELFFCTNILLFHLNLAKFEASCQNMKFSRGWYFYKCSIFFAQILLFCQKSAKFSTNCQKYEYFLGAILQMKIFVCVNILLFYWRSAKFSIFYH